MVDFMLNVPRICENCGTHLHGIDKLWVVPPHGTQSREKRLCDECYLEWTVSLVKESELIATERERQASDFNKPSHYHGGNMDVIQFLHEFFGDDELTATEGFFIGNILKYTCRFKEKNGMDDLKKAEDYIKRLITYEKDRL